jgi:hypothetical protein
VTRFVLICDLERTARGSRIVYVTGYGVYV